MDKLWSFSSRTNNAVDNVRQQWEEERDEQLDDDLIPLSQVLEDVDCFLNNNNAATTTHNSSREEQVPNCVVVLHKLLESMMDKYNRSAGCNGSRRSKFGKNPKNDKSFLYMVDRIFKLSTTTTTTLNLDKTTSILERVMFILENDLCALLEDHISKNWRPTPPPPPRKSSSFGSLQFQLQDHERESPKPGNPDDEDDEDDGLLPTFSPEDLSVLNKIVTVMINVGYHTECCMAFTNYRRIAFKTVLQKLGYTCIRMDEVYKMQWEFLEGEIATWNRVFRHCTSVLFNAERKLYNSVFSNQPHISRAIFSVIAQAVIVNFLNFAQAVVLTKPSPEKLFKFLDMYETLRDEVESVIILIHDDGSEQCAKDLGSELAAAKHGIIEAIVAMFYDLENSIKGDNERIPIPYGAVHPLTRYVMNYLKYACEYKATLEQVFSSQYCMNHYLYIDNNNNKGTSTTTTKIQEKNTSSEDQELDETPKKSPFVVQLMTIMDLLDVNTERKSKLYKDPALRCIFLMNNGRYIVQKIKGCDDLHESMGDNWCRRMQSSLRLHHKSYQRETWSKVVQCLNPDGLQQQGNKVSKQILRERFKCFNSMFEEIHKTQSSWIVSDEQLQSELRVSICSLVIPAYRSFMGRFKHHLESGKHADKYIKYHPDDLETLIDDFFVGNAMSMPRRRT
ncbi:exocyst complex component 7-like protein [Trifolium pratense]|uniref:Exocyst subunit Exo70 family protein n=1 Tax=Trifolium pratense TaxID=57577 RepID=A0A2K3MSQ5_TRIPR|nr:exocyst complex component 7-like protein [Trifolium pratense]